MSGERRSIPRGRARLSSAREWGAIALLTLLAWLSVAALHPLLDDFDWWLTPALISALALATAGIGRALGLLPIVATLVATAVVAVAIARLYAPESLMLIVVPTLETFPQLGELLDEAYLSVSDQSVPADVSPGIAFVLAIGAGLVALLLDAITFAWRKPAVAAAPVVGFMAITVFVRPASADAAHFVLAGIAYLMLLRLHRPGGRATRAIAVGATALIASLVVPTFVIPEAEPAAATRPRPAQVSINPYLNLDEDLLRSEPVLVYSYLTDSPEPLRFKVTTLDTLGSRWEPVIPQPQPGSSVDDIGEPWGQRIDIEEIDVTTTVEVRELVGRWLPVPFAPRSIEGLEGSWFWEPNGLGIRTNDANVRGQTYIVESSNLKPSRDQLLSAGTRVPTDAEPYAVLPANMPESVESTARSVVGDAATHYEQALALEAWLSSDVFTYSEESPVRPQAFRYEWYGVAEFLDVRRGYCVHFASAMAIMARTLGIPSRVVVGFQPGALVADYGNLRRFEVTTDNLHAWPELHFDGIGWVPFEPTPGIVGGAAVPSSGETAVPTPTAVPGEAQIPADRRDDSAVDPHSEALAAVLTWVTIGLLAVGAVAALLSVPTLIRRGRRRRRYRAAAEGRPAALDAWWEVLDTAVDFGVDLDDTATPRAIESALAPRLLPPTRDALRRLREALEAESFGREPIAPDPADVDAVRADLRASATRAARLSSRILPRSLALELTRRRADSRRTAAERSTGSSARLRALRTPAR